MAEVETNKVPIMIIGSDGQTLADPNTKIPVTILYQEGDTYSCEIISGVDYTAEELAQLMNEAQATEEVAESTEEE